MAIIRSTVDKNSSNYVSNYDYNKRILSELDNLKNKIHKMGPPSNLDRHRAKGKLTARERIQVLKDSQSSFLELSELAAETEAGVVCSGGSELVRSS